MSSGTARGVHTSVLTVLAGSITLMIVARLLFWHVPAGNDEAGYLMIGNGWHHGSSVYGDYWVDRPPLMIWIMQLSGDLTTLRILGLVTSALTVLGVARAAYVARGSDAARWAGAAAAVFSAAHWLGTPRVNGEMLAGAFVAWSFALTLQAVLRPGSRGSLLGLLSGALAACAMLIKQTIADGVVLAVVLFVVLAWQRADDRRTATRVLGWGVAGAGLTVGAGLAGAAARGTSPKELFDALVVFRFHAGEVVRTSASDATEFRLWALLAIWVVSGLAVVTVLACWHGARTREPVLLAAVGVIGVDSLLALLGGSYWGHYLLQLVPATALAVGWLADQVRPRLRTGVAVAIAVATLGNVAWAAVTQPSEDAEAEVVGHWLRDSRQKADTVVVAYGQPNVVSNAEMASPYPYLWSLPVRTLDPKLKELTAVLDGPGRPTWFVDWSGLESWGVDPSTLRVALREHYRNVADLCGRTIWLRQDASRRLVAMPRSCP